MSVQHQPSAAGHDALLSPGIYTPLREANSIRLVSIDAGNVSSPMTCNLVEANLNEPVAAYLALSYAWGDPDETGHISCDGKSLQATKSLIAAMRQLRERYPGRLFWIDAVCINQQDPVERAAQVQLMRNIYQSAENVVIYLGEDCHGLDRVMQLFHQLQAEAEVWTGDRRTARDLRDLDDTSIIRSRFPPAYDEVWYRFHDFFNRPWFSRIWIIQEVVMAAGDPEVICGPYTLSWSSLVSVAEFFLNTGLNGATIRKSKTSLVALMQNIKSSPELLSNLLWLTAPFASSEPHDKIFALYGLAHWAEEDLLASEYCRVDYQKEVKDVYRDLMFGYVMQHGSLELMTEANEVGPEERSVQGLPSWVPDWSLPMLSRHPSVGRQALPSGFDACGGQSTLVQGSMRAVNPDVLRIAGKVHDEVAWVSKPFDGYEYSQLPWHRRPFALQQLWEDVRERLGSEPQTYHGFWRTLLADADNHGYPVTDQLYPTFLRFWHNSKVHDQYAVRYRANNPDDLPLTEDKERELFEDYAADYGKAMTDEDYQAHKAWLELQASKFLPCDSTPDCRHCFIRALPLPEGTRVTGPSPALSMRDTDPFLRDFFTALGRDHRLIITEPFIVTNGGLMGLGPKRTRAGDAVAILSGAQVPFILHATGSSQQRLEIDVGLRTIREYRVVGDSYVHGIMRGEAVRDMDWNGGYEVLDLV
ncbi:HET-domain-containing protein [Coniochaeta ligniaria NRRL 30616]|uniref:HET-domain-containing protein n=1 Tax=Coniochaeta ligniaria NRRL 30616 TaxID=1408157 RepID=A0A1J7IZB1_9PEZI|nr:HET-domain-containing protein [Coniochaeta ligniaria NRRL 30616]